ncbi:hypothetical protein C8Q79DRAFT_910272 [Trametes meyenii]|nr:hypothetical protein C8Q79DRAFT_910272 [Trametes meyenii]
MDQPPLNQYHAQRADLCSKEEPQHKLGAAAILERREVRELRELEGLRLKGWGDGQLDDHFRAQRQSADRVSHASDIYWYKSMKGVLAELDDATHFISPSEPIQFLDVGCSPGGFSACVLQRANQAFGVGLALPVSSGGYNFMLEHRYRQRYDLIEQDIVLYNWGVPTRHTPSSGLRLPDEYRNHFTLVILDAHALRSYSLPAHVTAEEERLARGAYRDALLIAQFIIALSSVQSGGTIVTRLSHVECFPAAHLVYLLDTISDTLVLHKPRIVHSNRGTFYAIAKGVGKERHAVTMARYLDGLLRLWDGEFRRGGPTGTGRWLLPTDLDFVITADDILENYLDRLIDLGRGVWATQGNGLRYFFKKKGIQV